MPDDSHVVRAADEAVYAHSRLRWLPGGCMSLIFGTAAVVWAAICLFVAVSADGRSCRGNPYESAQLQMNRLDGLISNYRLLHENNQLPTSLVDLRRGDNPLVEYQSTLIDPWENRFIYERDGDSYRVWSMGPDGEPFTDDDIARDESW